jgi:hypothetical protein
MGYRIVLEAGVLSMQATLVLDEIERFRIALQHCSKALAALEDVPPEPTGYTAGGSIVDMKKGS